MKDLQLQTSSEDKEETITLGDLFGHNPIDQNSKIRLKLEMHSGTYGSKFAVAKVEVVG